MPPKNQNKKHQSQLMGSDESEESQLPDAVGFFILFTQIFPTIILLGYVTGFMDVQLSKLSSGSVSAGTDIVLVTTACICAVVGPFVSYFAKKYMEK